MSPKKNVLSLDKIFSHIKSRYHIKSQYHIKSRHETLERISQEFKNQKKRIILQKKSEKTLVH